MPAIDKLAAEGLPVTLAVSLHTPDDELRDTLVPVNTRWKVAEVLGAARRYATARMHKSPVLFFGKIQSKPALARRLLQLWREWQDGTGVMPTV